MSKDLIDELIKTYPDFPKKGILFRDITPVFHNPSAFKDLISKMALSKIIVGSEALVAIDARGFILGSALSIKLSKPLILARKPGKLPGKLISKSYELEYGENSLSIQKDILDKYSNYAIVDDLLATGGTAKCVSDILVSQNKKVNGLLVAIELIKLKGKSNLNFSVESILKY